MCAMPDHAEPEPSFLAATRVSYDTVAEDYDELARDELAGKPLDRALLALFAELVRARGGPVADVGCGTGRNTAHLRGLGLDVSGVDLSPGMLEVARRTHPELRFTEGSMTDLDLPEASLGGIVAMYSTIHVPLELLPRVFAGFHRALAPGGQALVVFQEGEEPPLRLEGAFGHAVSLDFHRRPLERIAGLLEEAGLAVHTRVLREPEGPETTRQAYLVARRPVPGEPPAGVGHPARAVRQAGP
ncbi:methyltransferase [Nocardiopsis sinuspersici]|uniref:Methyltransferase n=2 Tax=Nocardiopsidaceae TaxID=83676 RepID=A0A1V3BY66_9ACTN|nr:class I SAM-dependent methyltransferase [Nocardiopsis sinuspersici]OOC53497.1 methyltransferase [Nocardiopsis sinuspersici]